MTPTYSKEVEKAAATNSEERIEQQSMQDIILLLENLLEREETTVKIILDCLYDVGSVNLINKRFRSRSLKGIMGSIATMSKPVFRIFALRWLKKNCPRLITKWLRKQVTF